jgi:hypothetical protein
MRRFSLLDGSHCPRPSADRLSWKSPDEPPASTEIQGGGP